MRTLFMFLLVLFANTVIAQKKNGPYIYDSTVNGGHIQIMEYPDVNIRLRQFRPSVDSSENHKGDYVTEFLFQVTGNIINRTFILRFDKPINACELKCPDGVSQVTCTSNKEKTKYKFVVNKISAKEFSFVAFSKEGVYTKINEVSRYIPLE